MGTSCRICEGSGYVLVREEIVGPAEAPVVVKVANA